MPIIVPSSRLAVPSRPVIRPGWDDLPIDRPRRRSAWWRLLLSGVAGTTRLAPGICCGCGTNICVRACSLPLAGALVTILSGGTTVATCTTDTTGCCTVPVTGTYTVQITNAGSVIYSATVALSGTVTILTSSAHIICCAGHQIPDVLTGTDADGSFSLTYQTSGFSVPTWLGSHTVTRSSRTALPPLTSCTPSAPSSGPVVLFYTFQCVGGSPAFTLQREWWWIPAGGGAYAWYQSSTFGGGLPGVCFGASPSDDSTGSANPTSTNPFAVTFSSLTARLSDFTADPQSGSVAVSA